MSGRRIRIVTVQAVVVGALLLVVYLTLLRPDEEKPLFGVRVPAGPGQVAQVPGGESTGGHRGGQPGGRGQAHAGGHHGGGGAAAGPPGGAPSVVDGTTTGAPTAPPIPIRDGAEGGVTPSEDQYDDTVSRLFGNL